MTSTETSAPAGLTRRDWAVAAGLGAGAIATILIPLGVILAAVAVLIAILRLRQHPSHGAVVLITIGFTLVALTVTVMAITGIAAASLEDTPAVILRTE